VGAPVAQPLLASRYPADRIQSPLPFSPTLGKPPWVCLWGPGPSFLLSLPDCALSGPIAAPWAVPRLK